MAEEDVELILPHKHIRNTSAHGTFLIENQLEADQTSSIQSQLQERSPHNSVEQQQQNSSWSDCCPWEGSVWKRRSMQLDTTLGRGQTNSQSECPRPGVLHIGDKPPCLLGNPLKQVEWLEKPRLYSQEWVHSGLLTTSVRKSLHGSPPCCSEGASRNSMKL